MDQGDKETYKHIKGFNLIGYGVLHAGVQCGFGFLVSNLRALPQLKGKSLQLAAQG